MNLRPIYYRSPIGALEIRSTADHISHILFVNTHKREKINEDNLVFEADLSAIERKCIEQLKEYFDFKRSVFDLPLQQPGTSFQQKVWSALCDIPCGRKISYMDLSKRIGDVKAIRAVGTANGSNNISIVVPCHRVIGSNGTLVGYGGDLWRKQWLLEHEGKMTNGVQTLF